MNNDFPRILGDAFNAAAIAISELANALKSIGKTINQSFQCRFPGEHPADWVARVGIHKSGHNITDGEMWRFRANLDWWQGDDTPDQYGK